MNKQTIYFIIFAVVIAGAAFYGGMKYGQSNSSTGMGFANLSPEQRQQRAQQFGSNGGGGGRSAGGFISGEVISKEDKSVTVKLRDGGSKIVFLSGSTEISKSASGTPADIETGKNITVNGVLNPDGSITAQSIQLR